MNSNALSVSPSPEAQIRYHALRSTQIFTIFESVLAPDRLVRVLGSFVANAATT